MPKSYHMDHLISAYIGGPCSICLRIADPAHVIGMALVCGDCCKSCHPQIDWHGGDIVAGVQESLWA